MEIDRILNRLIALYDEGCNVKSTKEYSDALIVTPDTVDAAEFKKWQSKSIIFLENILKYDDFRLIDFKKNVNVNYEYKVVEGLAIINSLIEDIEDGNFNFKTTQIQKDSEEIIENILNKFHRVARQLRIRHSNRQTLEIHNEYDVQDLLHALLLIDFDDVRPEEWTPSYAGGSNRMDFLIKDANIVIETKMTRETLKDKEIGEQLIIDIVKYSKHPDCDKLYCFVYDKGEYIINPVALENDLSGVNGGLEVKVIIVPKF